MKLVKPTFVPPLDADFRPAVLANRLFRAELAQSKHAVPLILGLERPSRAVSRYETPVYPPGHPRFAENMQYVERILKFLLWQRGAYKVYVGGPLEIGHYLRQCYSAAGARSFDFAFIGEAIYETPLTVIPCDPEQVPPENEMQHPLGRHLEGYRIGFDLGASDIKVSAVVDGKATYSKEIIWEPGKNSDPAYHKTQIVNALKLAAQQMPRLDAIGGSSAGVIINNRAMIASLFRGIPSERFCEVRNMFQQIRDEWGVPLEVINDGEVTALAGSMSLEANGILGIALGSSEAGGYITMQGNITDWLDELAFAPVDYNPNAPMDDWSRDHGIGSQYFSQQCVFRLAPRVGIEISEELTNAEKLELVQEKLESGHEGALKIWQSMGYYMGYGVAHYADFYDLNYVLILGRCTSGKGGALILERANEVLKTEFPEIAKKVKIQLPDEKSRRVGQSIAAASLPVIEKKT